MYKETPILLCNTDDSTYELLVQQTNVLGQPSSFVIHMADFYSLPDDLQKSVTYTYLYAE